MTFGQYPFGLTDIKVFPLTGDTPGAAVQVPAGRVLEVTPTEDQVPLTGYNGTVATDVTATQADVTLEHGGISLELLAAITGGTIVTTGITPNQVRRLKVGSASVNRPYVRVIGKALGNDGGDAWVDIKKVKFNIPSGNFNEGEFYVSSMDGTAVRNDSGDLLEFLQHETQATVTAS